MQTIPFKLVARLCLAVSTLAVSSNFIMAQDTETPETLKEKVSYAYGLMIARQLTERGIEIDLGQFNAAFEAVVNDEELAMTEEEVSAAFTENQENMDKAGASGADKENLEAGQEFLEENAKREGVETTESGLQYEVLEKGDGPSPDATDTVTVHYHGTLIDGTVFDSSVERGEPANFPLNRVIPGWTEGVQLMSEGAKYRFFVPHDLAYGERGAGGDIKPYSTLIFDVELLEINDGE